MTLTKTQKKNTYCDLCGNKNKWVESDRFDTETGKKIMKPTCSSPECPRMCETAGHRWVNIINGLFSNPTDKCARCGKETTIFRWH